ELKPEDIERKLKRMKSPFLISQAFSPSVPAGGTMINDITIWNPDPTQALWVFAHVWVGSGNVDPVVGTFLLNVDARFPRLTEPKLPGASIDPLSYHPLHFALEVPTGVQKTNYFLNVCLIQARFFSVGVFLDRGGVPFNVT